MLEEFRNSMLLLILIPPDHWSVSFLSIPIIAVMVWVLIISNADYCNSLLINLSDSSCNPSSSLWMFSKTYIWPYHILLKILQWAPHRLLGDIQTHSKVMHGFAWSGPCLSVQYNVSFLLLFCINTRNKILYKLSCTLIPSPRMLSNFSDFTYYTAIKSSIKPLYVKPFLVYSRKITLSSHISVVLFMSIQIYP